MKIRNRKKLIFLIMTAFLIFLLMLLLCLAMKTGETIAYLTDSDSADNSLPITELSLTLTEPNYTEPTDVEPMQEIPKDPTVTNDGKTDEYVFLELQVPYGNLLTYDEAGKKTGPADTEIFSYTVNDGWVQVGTDTKADGIITRIYAWGGTAMTVLAPGASTAPLFDSVHMNRIVEGQGLDISTQDIQLRALGIQILNLNDGSGNTYTGKNADGQTSPEAVWTVVSNARGGA